MSYCPKCGSKIEEEMSFCPKCGAPLKVQQATAEARATYRKEEKAEKGEKREKTEKHEKHEYGFLGPLIGGLVLIFIGAASYLEITKAYDSRVIWAFFFVLIGVLIIVGAIYGYTMATKRHPRT
jgi:uncharacterized membrane protein YvbJ